MTMSEPKPFASLSSGLLARKGTAKPAMRPQGFGSFGGGLEDLGWNDMGNYAPNVPEAFEEPQEHHVPSSISALTPAPRVGDRKTPLDLSSADHDSEDYGEDYSEEETEELQPTPAKQQRAIAESFSAELPAAREPVVAPTPVVTLPSKASAPRRAPGLKDKSAFTLRLDAQRHLKLRLACAVRHRSAQQIVTEALDEFLQSLPELDALAGQVPARAGKQN
jgi:hypothetical protein